MTIFSKLKPSNSSQNQKCFQQKYENQGDMLLYILTKIAHSLQLLYNQKCYLFKKLLFTMENATTAGSSQSNVSRLYI